MAGPWDLTPNRNLMYGGAIAKGVEKFVSAYQGQQNRNREFALREQEINAQAELRRLQVEKLRQEMAPVEFSLQKFQTIDKAFGAGIVPEKMKNEAAKEVMESADTPQKLKFLNTVIDRKKSADLRAMSSSSMAENFGSGTEVMNVPEVPEAPVRSAGAPAAPEIPESLMLNPKEAEFYGGLIKSKYGAQAQFAGIQQRDAASERTFQASLANYDSRLTAAKDANETRQIVQEMRNELARFQTGANNQNRLEVQESRNEGSYNTQKWRNRGNLDVQDMRNKGSVATAETRNKGSLDVAGVNAGSREKVAGINAASRERAAKSRGAGKASTDPSVRLLEKQIVETQKTINSLYKPSTGFSMETPREIEVKRQGLQNQLSQMQAAYKTATGFDYGAAVEKGQGQPAKKQGGQGAVPQGNPRPKFSRGPGIAAKIKELPDGTELEIDGAVFQKQGGQLLPR